jgi:hypothetical protein
MPHPPQFPGSALSGGTHVRPPEGDDGPQVAEPGKVGSHVVNAKVGTHELPLQMFEHSTPHPPQLFGSL